MLDLEKLYQPYSKHASLPDTLAWVQKEAGNLKIDRAIVETAITEVFLEMANGLTFSKTHPDLPVDHANMNLYLKKRMIDLNNKIQGDIQKAFQQRIEKLVEAKMKAISKTDKEYIKMNRPPFKERIKNFFKGGDA